MHSFVLLLEEIQFFWIFPFLNKVRVFSSKMVSVCCLKYPNSCFSSHFCFQVIDLLIILLSMLYLIAVISLLCSFLCSSWVLIMMHYSSMLVSPLPPSFLGTYSHTMSTLGCKVLCIVISFLFLCSICLSPSQVYSLNDPEELARETAQMFISLRKLLVWNSSSRSPEILLFYSFFSFISTCLMVYVFNIPKFL